MQQYQTPQLPKGTRIRIRIHSSWGDRHYVGLNGIQFFNDQGSKIDPKTQIKSIKAYPSSVNTLPGCEKDVRTVDKLLNGNNQTYSEVDMWLAPLTSEIQRLESKNINSIVVEFKKNQGFSAINFFNYAKTSQRGAREVQIYVGDALLYRVKNTKPHLLNLTMINLQCIQGYLCRASDKTQQRRNFKTTVCFTKDIGLLKAVQPQGYSQQNLEQRVSLVNQKVQVRQTGVAYQEMQRPTTSVVGQSPFI